MKKNIQLIITLCSLLLLMLSCTSRDQPTKDIINDTFPEAQAELHNILQNIYDDAINANIEGLTTAHLNSNKFTKFGPRSFERQTVEQTNIPEASFFSSISELSVELKDIKIDVFEDVAITTFYPHYSLTRDSVLIEGMSRQTLVFLKTEQGWKIIHEHGTQEK